MKRGGEPGRRFVISQHDAIEPVAFLNSFVDEDFDDTANGKPFSSEMLDYLGEGVSLPLEYPIHAL